MTVSIIDRSGELSDKQRDDAERRLLFALSRFHPKIKRVSLVIANVDGPRGSVEKWCRIAVRLHRGQDVVVSDQDSALPTCVSRLADRAARAVARGVDQQWPAGRPGTGYRRGRTAV